MYTILAMCPKDATSGSCCCPIYKNMEALSKKWVWHILRVIAEGKTVRFTEVKDALPDINSRILSERLSDLEEEGMIERSVKETKPIVIEYAITEKGKDFKGVLDAFCSWAKKWG